MTKNTTLGVIFAALIAITSGVFHPSFARAEVSNNSDLELSKKCAELVKECFAYTDSERAHCFFSSSKHPFCDGTALGSIAYHRWAMSPSRPDNDDEAPALLGPVLVDQACLANFDNQFSGELVKGDYTPESLRQLESRLKICNRELTNELLRP